MTNNKNGIPKLRFPGYTEPWEQRKLGEVFNQTVEYINPSEANLELWSVTVENGLTPKTERYNREALVKKNDKFKVVHDGDIVYNPMNLTIGAVGFNKTGKSVAVSGYYITMNMNAYFSNNYFKTWLKSANAIKQYKLYATGSLIEKQRVQFPTLSLIKSYIPNFEEQQKIGTFFQQLDNLITLHQRKLDDLKAQKKGLLQKMFPKNGEDVPEVRFPSFNGAWEQHKFKNLYKKVIEKNDLSFGSDRIISVANMYYKPNDSKSDEKYMETYNIFRLGDIAFEGHKSKNFAYGRFVENTIGDGIVSHVFDVFRPISEYDLNYWKYFIHYEDIMGQKLRMSTTKATMMNNLVSKDFLKQSVLVPNLDEQQKIGTFFQKLDNLITFYQRKIEHLQLQKKGLLQQMFV
ncbi:restriction endonuclease subunit S [Liquorilactobacillus nagelii]|uniref:restriction endonuclease subunit S n=1 Tax=Liquorilactobacillus nagelii TaxID=82688 RepID=UPI0039E983D9